MTRPDRPIYNLLADLAGAREENKPRLIRQAFAWQLAAERRRIRKAIRAEIARVEARWDAAARAEKDAWRRLYVAESCARIVSGLDYGLQCVTAPRAGRGGGGR